MNKIFKVVWSASKQCYVVASELASNTSGKKKIMVATVLAALAMGGSLQVGAETTVTADKVNASNLEAGKISVERAGVTTEFTGNEINMFAETDDPTKPWKAQLMAGFLGMQNNDSKFLYGEDAVEIRDLEDKNAAGMTPKGFGVSGENNKEMQFTLDKVDVGGNKIENVAEGTADTDAVNVKQLKSYVDSKSNSTPVRIPTISQRGVNTNVLIGANPDGSTNYTVSVNPDLLNMNSAEFGLDTEEKRALVNKEKAQFFDGDVNTAISAKGTKLENTNNLDTAEYTMDGMQANSNGKLVRFGTLGITAGDQVISGVKAGVADTDVVNVKQLKDSITQASNAASVKLGYKADGANAQTTSLKDGLNFKSGELTTATVGENGEVTYNVKTATLTVDGKGTVKGEAGVATSDNVANVINQVVQQNSSDTKELKQAISNVSTESQRVGAHAAAMAALKPIQYDPMEPTQVMAGIGNYRGETAAALGLAHYTNENTMLNVGVSLGGTHNMVNAGVTHKFGSSPEKKNIPDRYKGGPISSIYVMQDELTQMQAKNEAQQAKIDAQQAQLEQQQSEINSLKAVVNQLLAKA